MGATMINPATMATYHAHSDVAGNGTATNGNATFSFGTGAGENFAAEQEANLVVADATWSKTLTPPTAGWQLSPSMMGGMMLVRDHTARLKWGSGASERLDNGSIAVIP